MEWTAWNNGSYHSSGGGYGFKGLIAFVTIQLPIPHEEKEACRRNGIQD